MRIPPKHRTAWLLAAALLTPLVEASAVRGAGELTITVVDRDSGKQIPCRMHLRNERDKPQKTAKAPFWHDHFTFPGTIKLKLPQGTYHFEIERGPEWVVRNGYFIIENRSVDSKTLDLKRLCDMADEGWWSGDLHIHRATKDIELLMLAEDLHVAPVVTWWNDKNQWANTGPPEKPVRQFDTYRYYDLMAGEDEREGGALLFFNLREPLALAGASREYPSSLKFLREAKQQPNAWVDAEKPFWWDVPLWLAGGKVDSIGLCNNHLCRSKMITDEAWGKPRDKKLLPDPLGNGLWSQEIYYHVLNCGLRIPPSAGSASGVLPNPLGYNRVYVWVDKYRFNYETWWEGFKAGRVVVTNGPLIRPLADGRPPGHVFQVPKGETFSAEIGLIFSTRDPISYLEVVKDGHVVETVRLAEYAKTGRIPPVEFDSSGWFLVRAVTDLEDTYRFTSSGPWYVEVGEQPKRVSRRSAQFFLDWARQRRERINLDDAAQRREVLQLHDEAIKFWEELVSKANAD